MRTTRQRWARNTRRSGRDEPVLAFWGQIGDDPSAEGSRNYDGDAEAHGSPNSRTVSPVMLAHAFLAALTATQRDTELANPTLI